MMERKRVVQCAVHQSFSAAGVGGGTWFDSAQQVALGCLLCNVLGMLLMRACLTQCQTQRSRASFTCAWLNGCDQDIKAFVFKAQTLMPQVMLLWLASASGWLATFARNDLQACIIDEAIGITISCCMTLPCFP